jgi:DNA-binding MarR family transcriptional regulator
MTTKTPHRENLALVLALLRAAQVFHRAIGPVFRDAGLTAPQWDVLETLSNQGPLTINDLLSHVLGTSGNVDVVIKNLMRLGFVEKEISAEDSRVRVVQLTEAGKAKVATFMPGHNQALHDIFGQLTSMQKRQTVQQLNQLRKLMAEPKET